MQEYATRVSLIIIFIPSFLFLSSHFQEKGVSVETPRAMPHFMHQLMVAEARFHRRLVGIVEKLCVRLEVFFIHWFAFMGGLNH